MIDRFLPDHPRARRAVLYGGSALLLAFLTQVVFPGSPGGGRGTPAAILYAGLVSGLVIALYATGLVLMYRTMRFVNFSQGPIGLVGSLLLSYFLVFTDVPFPVVVVLGVLVCAALGAIAGVFLLRFFRGSRLFLTVVTIIGGTFMIQTVLPGVTRLPFWPPPNRISTAEFQDLAQLPDDLPLAGWKYRVGSFPLDFGFGQAFAIEIALVTLLALVLFMRYTRTGTAIRAMAENPERASLLGIGVGGLSILVWTIAGAIDGVATIAGSTAGTSVFSNNTSPVDFLILPLAAAVIARFRDFGPAVFAAVAIGVVREAWLFGFRDDTGLFTAILFGVVVVGLLVQRRRLARASGAAAVSWSATDEPRPIPHELRSIPGVRLGRLAIIGALGLTALILPFTLPAERLLLAGTIFVNAIAVLSLVVLTGWAGQVSLGQYGLVAVGSVVGGALTASVGLPFWVAVPLATAVTAGVAVVVGLPALRVRGLFLLVTTFGFAVAVSSVLFNDRYFGWLLPNIVDRPTLFFIDFEDERSMYYLCLAALALAIVVVVNLRKSRVGRLLIALRENETNVQSFGVSAVRLKLLAFAIAGGMAGFAGAIFAHQQRGVSAESFTPLQSFFVFTAAVVGGVSSPGGALLGSAYSQLSQEVSRNNELAAAFFQGTGPLVVLFLAPGGLISVVNAMRDSVLRIVAQRRRIVVPSLFADYDPDLLARRLIPLGDADSSSGLAALPAGLRFVLRSELYKGKGERIVDKLGPPRRRREAEALSAAARRVEDMDDGRGGPSIEVPAAAGVIVLDAGERA